MILYWFEQKCSILCIIHRQMRVANEVFATFCIISLGSCERDGSLFVLPYSRPIIGQCLLSWPIRDQEIFSVWHMSGITWILTHLSRFYPLHKSTKRRETLAKSREMKNILTFIPLLLFSQRHLVWWSYVWISNLYKWDRYFSAEEAKWTLVTLKKFQTSIFFKKTFPL